MPLKRIELLLGVVKFARLWRTCPNTAWPVSPVLVGMYLVYLCGTVVPLPRRVPVPVMDPHRGEVELVVDDAGLFAGLLCAAVAVCRVVDAAYGAVDCHISRLIFTMVLGISVGILGNLVIWLCHRGLWTSHCGDDLLKTVFLVAGQWNLIGILGASHRCGALQGSLSTLWIQSCFWPDRGQFNCENRPTGTSSSSHLGRHRHRKSAIAVCGKS